MTAIDHKLADSGPYARFMWWFARGAVAIFCRVFWRLSIEGRENLPATGAYVLAPVHRSNVDTLVVGALQRRRVRFMGKDSLWKQKWAGWFLSAVGGFPVTRGAADLEALRTCGEMLDGGEPLVVFPEGQRRSGPVVQELYDGAAYLALRSQVPIVPVGIGGSERAMPKGSKLLRPVKIHAVVGAPIQVPALEGKRVPRDQVRAVTAQLYDEVQRLFDIARVRARD